MIEFAFIHNLIVFLINVTALGLAGIVYFNNPKGKMNKIFVLMVVSMLGWVNFAFFARVVGADRFNLASLFLRIAWFITPLLFVFLYFLVIYLIKKEKEYQFLNKIVLFVGGVAAFITGFTDLIIKGMEFVDGDLTIIYGRAMFPFLGMIFFLICATLYPLIKGYLKFLSKERMKIEYFLVGISIFYLGNIIFNITLPLFLDIVHLYYLGDYSTIFLLGFTGYAIVARELFGARVLLTQVLVGAIAILLLWQAITAITLFDFAWKISLFLLFLFFGYFLIQSVIREIKRRAELQELYTQVDKLSKTKSEFLSIASHQLRTPLTVVKGYISMMLEKTYGKPPERMEKPLKNIYVSNERLIKLVNDLLNLSRLEAGKIEFNPEPTSLKEMVSSIIEELKINAEKKDLYIKIVKSVESLPKIMADRDKLRQAIFNIIDNAIKYSKKGGITIELKKLDSREQIRISDIGEGMNEKEIKNLFQMFSRATAGNQLHIEGAGIGLYIAKRFVEMHNGKIWAESPGKGKGSTFYIELPITKTKS